MSICFHTSTISYLKRRFHHRICSTDVRKEARLRLLIQWPWAGDSMGDAPAAPKTIPKSNTYSSVQLYMRDSTGFVLNQRACMGDHGRQLYLLYLFLLNLAVPRSRCRRARNPTLPSALLFSPILRRPNPSRWFS